jgi:hypothetical protein
VLLSYHLFYQTMAATKGVGNTAPVSSLSALAASSKGDTKVVKEESSDEDDQVPPYIRRLNARLDGFESRMVTMAANTLPSPIGISSSSGSSGGRQTMSLTSALRSPVTAPAKSSVAARPVTAMSSSVDDSKSMATLSTPPAIMQDGHDEDGLTDIGVDGTQDEPTAADQAAALAARLAITQCAFVDDEHDGSFVTWYKSVIVWKDSFKREAKLMCLLADKMREEGVSIDRSDSFEMVCCRIAALQCLNEGDGSAVADIIEHKHHKSMVPQGVRLAAIKQANMINRTKLVIKNDSKGSNDKKKQKKGKGGSYYGVTKNTGGHHTGKAGGTAGVKK